MIQPATNSLGQILTEDFGFAKLSTALKVSGSSGHNEDGLFLAPVQFLAITISYMMFVWCINISGVFG